MTDVSKVCEIPTLPAAYVVGHDGLSTAGIILV